MNNAILVRIASPQFIFNATITDRRDRRTQYSLSKADNFVGIHIQNV
jgi:hypothetical protein